MQPNPHRSSSFAGLSGKDPNLRMSANTKNVSQLSAAVTFNTDAAALITEAEKKMKPEEGADHDQEPKEVGVSRGVSMLDLFLRILAIVGTLGSAVAMGTTDETLPFSTQAFIFQAQYDDIPAFRFFVIANATVCGYLALSLPMAIYHVIKRGAAKSRVLLIFLDAIMLAVLTAGASTAAAIVYLAHKGNASANWVAICQQYQSFCNRVTGSLIGSFAADLILILLIPLSGLVLSKRAI